MKNINQVVCYKRNCTLGLMASHYSPCLSVSFPVRKESSGSRSHSARTSRVSEKSPLLASSALGYYKLHTRKPLHSVGPTKQLLSSFTFIPNLSVHKGTVFKCQISYKGKDKIVMERVSEKFTVLCKEASLSFYT